FVRSCDICQRQKYSATSPGGLLQPLPIPNAVWEDLSIDFVTGLPKSKGFEAVLVVVDRLSKYSHFILLKHPYTAKSVAEIFVKEVVRLHGIPSSIVSDRDPIFISHFWKELFKLQGTQLRMGSAYHPETDGQTEVINRCLESYLRCFASDQPKSWAHWIPWSEFWYNSTYHVSIGKSPFEVVYGRPPPTILRFLSNETKVAAVALELTERDEALNQLKSHLLRAQQQMKIYADKKRRDVQFAIGDWVFLKLRPHRQHSVIKRINQKLAARFYGPFQVIEKIGEVAYKLQLPDTSRIHPIFHVSLLKKAVGDYPVQGELPKELEIAVDSVIYPEKVLGSRVTLQGNIDVPQSLIQWKNKPLEDVTWEDDAFIAGQFPEFSLEDKALFETGGIDRDVGLNENGKPKMPKQTNKKPTMGDRIDILESQFGAMQITLASVVDQLKEMSKKLDLQGSNHNASPTHNSAAIPAGNSSVMPVHEDVIETSNMNESRLAGKKVKLPLFEGDDPVAWITRAEIYFDVQQTPDEMRVKLSRLSMEGPTIHWFNLLMETEDHLTWEKLKKSLIARYGGRRLENPFEELSTLRQSGSVEEFVEAFELLSSQVGRLPEEQYL
ncbi:Ty3/gypsy retrotransposon protein, partial [Trifolium medium]|nr:Ty3/gypsy retrotransposon protein [Trifolium medium]